MGSAVIRPPWDKIRNVPQLLEWWATHYGDAEALYHKNKGWWEPVTWKGYLSRVDEVVGCLRSAGVKRGDRVSILSTTRLEWVITDMAILSCGAVTTPIYQSNTAEQCEYVIHHSDCKIIFLEDQEQLDKLLKIWGDAPHVELAVVYEPFEAKENDKVISFQDFLTRFKRSEEPESPVSLRQNTEPNDIATIVYTSGTTGPPKGVVLSHGNLLFTIQQIVDLLDLNQDDLSLAYLPMAHVAERMVGSLLKLGCGAKTAFAESMDDMGFNMREVGPTFHFGTPRVFEKFHAKVKTTVDDATFFQKNIYIASLALGQREMDSRLNGGIFPLHQKMALKIMDWLVLRKVRDLLGGEVKLVLSGAAPISSEILRWLQSVGLNVVEAYGMTESSALITANRPWENRLGSVGKAIPKTEMKTAGDGEVLTRGPHVSQGYYKNEMATRKTIDENGWLHTGDMGKIDEDGFLWITDRKKDILITAAGKNVAPQNIENLMKTSKYVSQFMVFGDRRKYLVGLLTLDEDEVTKYARDRQLIYSDLKELSQLLEINDLISSEVLRMNGKLASYETVKMFRILEEELSQDDDEVTPTLKVKRNVIEKRYGHLIEEMYGVKR